MTNITDVLAESITNESNHFSISLKLNIDNVAIEHIDSETGLISMKLISLKQDLMHEEKLYILANVIQKAIDEAIKVTIASIDENQYKLITTGSL